MLNKKIKGRILGIAVFSILFAVAIFLLPDFVFAQVDTGINSAAGIGLSDTDPRIIVARVIRVILGFLGIIALVLILYAGWMYMTSAGAPDKVDKAKKILSSAAIGLIIILSAFAIATFIINALLGASMGGGSGSGSGAGGFNNGVPTSGNSIIESHYPERDQVNVPRNTSIVVTFKEDMDPTQIIQNTNGNALLGDCDDFNSNSQNDPGECDLIDEDYVLIYKTDDGTATATLVTEVIANVMPDNRTFRFKPFDYLGSPSEALYYSVAFSSQLDKGDGTDAFPGAIGAIGYVWQFLVSTIIDVTPPRVVSVIPYPSTTEPRNVVVQINFNEAVSPLSSSGSTLAGFNNIVVNDLTGADIVDGNFYISNQYRTVEFLTEDFCGRNSCGDRVYCLPATSSIEVLVKAATLVMTGEATALFPFDGTVDMADNSLDGNKDGNAQGPDSQSGLPPYNENIPDPLTQGDSYRWDFNTSDQILLSAPTMLSIYPGIGDVDVGYNERPTATFDRLMMSSSMIKHWPPTAIGSVALYSTSSLPFSLAKYDNIPSKQTTIEIRHDPFLDFNDYTPEFNAGLKDIYQNCFYTSAGPGCSPTPTSTPTAFPYCCEGALSTLPCN
ncbi:MAG: hypothetical protein PF572_02470 [Patescibacteria group bacterium]|jgi:hypothetical protein|nr:hypothetical protein [Patescibacteria group bacterium]